jgi:hypothetical protein
VNTPVSDATSEGRRATLEAIRDRLAKMLDGAAGHEPGCPCECGAAYDVRAMAPISKELREVMQQLDDLPNENGESEVGDIAAQREKRRQQAQANAAARE